MNGLGAPSTASSGYSVAAKAPDEQTATGLADDSGD